MKEKNLSIELLKFFAVIMVVNSHFDTLYGNYDALATGGAIGDALFFFVSGFTIFLGRFGQFDNWYKRRIKRIYPSIIAWAAVMSYANIEQFILSRVVNGGGYWFITCIMIYYVGLYFVRKFQEDNPLMPFVVTIVAVIAWYCFEDSSKMFMYGETYFKWLFNFLFMLAGAYVGNNKIELKSRPLSDSIILLFSIIVFYGLQIVAGKYKLLAHLQIFTLIPLMGIVLYAYKFCKMNWVGYFMRSRNGLCLRLIAGLCLEAYIVQFTIISIMEERMGTLFPLSLLITFVVIMVAAYLTRCLARIFTQIFEKEDMDWYAVIKAV